MNTTRKYTLVYTHMYRYMSATCNSNCVSISRMLFPLLWLDVYFTCSAVSCQSRSQSCLSCCHVPSGAHDQIFISVRQLWICWCRAPSLTRGRVCRLLLLLALASAVVFRSECRGTHDHILLFQIWDSSNLEGQVSIFISPRNRVTQLYPRVLGFLFAASYDSQGYCGGMGVYGVGSFLYGRWGMCAAV
jgi:hypothetical protein